MFNTESMVTTAQGLEKFLKHIKSFFSKEDSARVSISTAHGYKGLENDAVIILDAIERRYPLIHPDWIFTQIFGSTVEAIIEEERRLFYVAATRSKELTYIFHRRIDQPLELSLPLIRMETSLDINSTQHPYSTTIHLSI